MESNNKPRNDDRWLFIGKDVFQTANKRKVENRKRILMTLSSQNSPFLSPLRYPGSKRRLTKYIKEALSLNEIRPQLFIEPFVGGASVALQLMRDGLTDQVILMDIDPWITSFWQTAFFDSDWLIDQIRTVEITLQKWYELKNSNPQTIRDQAFVCFFLNRTSFSGILEHKVGPIGGKQQKSAYKIDCRFSRDALAERIYQVSLLKEKVYGIWNCSWSDGMTRIQTERSEGLLTKSDGFYYLDPPFFEEAEALYRYYFVEKDHEELRDFLLALPEKWILSYDSADQIEMLYGNAIKKGTNGTRQHHVELLYSLASMSERRKGKEVIITNLKELPEPNLLQN